MPIELIPGPFDAPGNWYRGGLHIHTTESDGSIPPDRTVRQYHMGGYDFIALTDHNRVSVPSQCPPDFAVLRGCEFDVGETELGNKYHIVGVGLEPGRDPQPRMSPQATIDAITAAGGYAFIAHPYWSGLSTRDLLGVTGYGAIEVYNAVCDVEIGRANSEVHLDDLLSRQRIVNCVAVDDTHWPVFDAIRAWVMVRASELTPAAITASLRQGRFYASTGPLIYSVTTKDNAIEVECSPAASITLVCDPTLGGKLTAGRAGPGIRARRLSGRQAQQSVGGTESLTGASFPLSGRERYGRIRVEDAAGRCAWTNPLFVRTQS